MAIIHSRWQIIRIGPVPGWFDPAPPCLCARARSVDVGSRTMATVLVLSPLPELLRGYTPLESVLVLANSVTPA